MNNDDWILRELKTGLQKLICLRLEGCPPDDAVKGTLLAWHEAIWSQWYEEAQDAPRFQAAFSFLLSRVKRWPCPAQLLEAMPPREAKREPFRIQSEEQRERNRIAAKKSLDALAKLLHIPETRQ